MKTFPQYRHRLTGLKFFIVGATETSTSKRCFVVRESPQGRERLFEVDGFDIAFVEREALFLILIKKETARLKAKVKDEKRRENRRHVDDYEAVEAEDQAERDAIWAGRISSEYDPDVSEDDEIVEAGADSETIEPEIIEAGY